jgi:hypothetical protein
VAEDAAGTIRLLHWARDSMHLLSEQEVPVEITVNEGAV